MADQGEIDLGHYQRAVDIYRQDLVAWTLLYGVFTVVAIGTMGLGMVLAPNVFRATRDAIEEDRPPTLGLLFRTDRIVDDATVVVAFFGASFAASSLLGPLATAVSILLGLAPPLVADDRYGGVDALKLSFARVLEAPMPAIVHGMAGLVLALPGVCCLLPFPFVLPIAGIATWLFYLEQREAFDVLAASQGMRRLDITDPDDRAT